MGRVLLAAVMFASAGAFMAPQKVSAVSRAQAAVGGWEKDYYSTVNVDPSQLDAAFTTANGAAIDSKISEAAKAAGVDTATAKSKLVEAVGDLGILNTDVKKLKDILAPPPPKEK